MAPATVKKLLGIPSNVTSGSKSNAMVAVYVVPTAKVLSVGIGDQLTVPEYKPVAVIEDAGVPNLTGGETPSIVGK